MKSDLPNIPIIPKSMDFAATALGWLVLTFYPGLSANAKVIDPQFLVPSAETFSLRSKPTCDGSAVRLVPPQTLRSTLLKEENRTPHPLSQCNRLVYKDLGLQEPSDFQVERMSFYFKELGKETKRLKKKASQGGFRQSPSYAPSRRPSLQEFTWQSVADPFWKQIQGDSRTEPDLPIEAYLHRPFHDVYKNSVFEASTASHLLQPGNTPYSGVNPPSFVLSQPIHGGFAPSQ